MEDRAETPGKHPCPPPASAPQSRSQKPARASSVDRGLAVQAETDQKPTHTLPAHARGARTGSTRAHWSSFNSLKHPTPNIVPTGTLAGQSSRNGSQSPRASDTSRQPVSAASTVDPILGR